MRSGWSRTDNSASAGFRTRFRTSTKRMRLAIGLKDEHRISVAVKAILRLDGFLICLTDQINPGEGTDEHQQARPGQVKVRDERVYNLEAVGRVDVKVRLSRPPNDWSPGSYCFEDA